MSLSAGVRDANAVLPSARRLARRGEFPARVSRPPSMDKNSLMGSQSLNYRLDFQLVYRVRGE
jgi:hypothetical protein